MKILNDIVCKLNWIEIQFYNWTNGMHIGKEGIENLLMSMVWKKTHLKIQKIEKILFHATLLGNEFFENHVSKYPNDDLQLMNKSTLRLTKHNMW